MESSVLSLPIRERSASEARAVALPWQLVAVVFASTSILVGLVWDISWHMTIGRDTFWTPAHLAIYTGGAVAGISCGYEVLRRSWMRYRHGEQPRDGVTVWRVFNGPLGGWICIWGAVAMLTSAPFDDWWHNAYGLDVKIISPPHSILALGFYAICIGALIMALAEQARQRTDLRHHSSTRAPWMVAYMSGLVLTMIAIFTYEYQDRVLMHHSVMYIALSIVMPAALVVASLSARLRYPATAAAGVYMLLMALQVWILPLFAATPKLGPIRQSVTHMVPLDFPLLLIVPALCIDLIVMRTSVWNGWLRALLLGAAFLVTFVAAQWSFGAFLMHGPSQNWVFRADNFPYMVPTDWDGPMRKFAQESPMSAARGFGIALVVAVFSSRLGLAWGSWLRTVKR